MAAVRIPPTGSHVSAAAFLARLQGVRSIGASRWIAKCPAHEDRSPCLSVRELEDGTVLIKCFAGCGASDVVAIVGLSLRDLFPERAAEHRRKPTRAWLDARDALACLAKEGQVLAVAAEHWRVHRAFDDGELERVSLAACRISDVWRFVNGHR